MEERQADRDGAGRVRMPWSPRGSWLDGCTRCRLLVIEGLRPNAALTESARMTRKRVPGIVAPLALWWLAITGVAIAITWACRQVTDGALDWAGIDVHRVLPLVALFLAVTIIGGFLYGGLHLGGHQFLVTRMYAEQRDPERRHAPAASRSRSNRTPA